MPIYVYRCRRCGEEFEKVVLSAARADDVVCPFCQGDEVERRPALFGVGSNVDAVSSSGRGCAPAAGGG